MIILDTNVLSELLKPEPSSVVAVWLSRQPVLRLFTTAVTQAEILYGVELLPKGKRKSGLMTMVAAIFEQDFDARILPFDSEAARAFPGVAAARRAAGRPIAEFDAQIAAIAQSRGATLATRNTADFDGCGVPLFNPWLGP
ncbi:MAG TPA: type II toxin-antitoxin system VapC family toxin [Bryobacteraceae bacterium]|jgi:predicted nucleic acid-binding protein|nr:type II toxin-antitoxin system VapC family toxin [Bryobacteraceae bacterium]